MTRTWTIVIIVAAVLLVTALGVWYYRKEKKGCDCKPWDLKCQRGCNGKSSTISDLATEIVIVTDQGDELIISPEGETPATRAGQALLRRRL